MKFVAIALLLFIGAVSAAPTAAPHQNSGRDLVESLEKRASSLLEYVKKVIADHHAEHGHLLAALEHQSAQLSKLVAELKHQVADKNREHHLHQIHVLEEQLLFLSNRIAEELVALEEGKNPDHPHKGDTLEQLVAHAEELIKKGQAAMAKHPQAVEVGEIERETIILKALIAALHQKPSPTPPAELKKEQDQLARLEKSLQQLIEKINARKP